MSNPFDRAKQADSRRAKIIASVERLSTLFRANLQDHAVQHGLSPLQIQILVFIAYHTKESCNTSSIAQEFAVTKPTVSDAIRVLVEKRLLQKKRDAQDARAFILQLTAKGRKKVETLAGFTQPFGKFLDNAREDEIDSVWHGLLLLMQQLQHSNIIPVRMCFTCDYFGKEHLDGAPHYCHLMNQPLAIADIRIDCPEHKVK